MVTALQVLIVVVVIVVFVAVVVFAIAVVVVRGQRILYAYCMFSIAALITPTFVVQ